MVVDRKHRALWLRESLRDPSTPPLDGRQNGADIVIVGGGYVGLWTAIRIRDIEPNADVAIVEADICGGGASGRNGGFVLSWWPKASTLRAMCGDSGARHMLDASEHAIDEIEQFCAAHAPDAEFHRGGLLWTATSPSHVGSWRGVVETASQLGRSDTFVQLSPDEVARRSGSPNHLAGVLEASGATVHPGHLVRALRRVALQRGVRIYENSPMKRLHRLRTPVVECRSGSIAANRVVLAMNAWGSQIRELRSKLFVISSDIVATEPIPTRLSDIGWTGGEAITDSQTLVCYYRTTKSGRVLFGKGGWAIGMGSWMPSAMEQHRGRARMVARDFRRYYPQLRDVAITHDWAGPIDRTYTSLPIFGRLGTHENVLYGVGWSGNGVGPSVVGGKILASMALDRHDGWSENGLVHASARSFPPEPARYVGAHLVREAIIRKERAEALGLRPSRVASTLSRLAPSGLEDKV